MTETEWRNLGIQQSPGISIIYRDMKSRSIPNIYFPILGWTHYMLGCEAQVICFRRPLGFKEYD